MQTDMLTLLYTDSTYSIFIHNYPDDDNINSSCHKVKCLLCLTLFLSPDVHYNLI